MATHNIYKLPAACANYFGFKADKEMNLDNLAKSDNNSLSLKSGCNKFSEDYNTVMGFNLAAAGEKSKDSDVVAELELRELCKQLLSQTTWTLWTTTAKKVKNKRLMPKSIRHSSLKKVLQ